MPPVRVMLLLCLTPLAVASAQSVNALHRSAVAPAGCPSPQQSMSALESADALLQGGQYSDVVTLLQPLAKPKCDPRFSLLLAAAYDATGNTSAELPLLDSAHAAWPANTSIAASLARQYMSRGDTAKAAAALDGFHITAQTPLQEIQEAALVYIAGHRLPAAQAMAEAAYARKPSLPTLLLLANVLQLEGRYKDVNRLLAPQRETYANAPGFLITLAESESDAMLFDDARADLERAIALDDRSYQAHYLLGALLAARNETDRAEQEFRRAIELAPAQPRTYYQLALLYRDRQDETQEESLLSQALAADDHYAPALCEQGRILLEQHRLDDAVAKLKLAIQYNPQLERAYYLCARAYAGLGDKAQADAMVSQYKSLRATNRQTSVDTQAGQLGVAGTQQP